MERRDFLKLAFGVAAGAAAFSAAAQAAPLSPQPLQGPADLRGNADAHQAVISGEEAAQIQPEQVHWGWRHRHWGWRHRWHHHRHWW